MRSPLSKTYLNKTNTSYKEIYKSKENLTLLKAPIQSRPRQAYQNGVLIGNSVTLQGLFVQNQGVVFMTLAQAPQGLKAFLYVFSDATFCYFTVKDNVLHGNCIFMNQSAFIQCYLFKMDKLQGYQYSYIPSIRQLTKSLYKNNNLVKITESGFCPADKNPITMFDNPELVGLLNKMIELNYKVKNVESIEIPNMRYFGEIEEDQPNGYGTILSLSEMFCGQFREGLLEGFGRIRFENGDVIQGYFNHGECKRFGKFIHNGQEVYKADNTTISLHQYEHLVQNYASQQERLNRKFLMPFFDRISKIYKNLISNYYDDSASKLIRQASRLISSATQTQLNTDEIQSKSPSEGHMLRVDSIQRSSEPLIVVHKVDNSQYNRSGTQQFRQDYMKSKWSRSNPKIMSSEPSKKSYQQAQDEIAEEISQKAISKEFAHGTPKFFEAKMGEKQRKAERVFKKTREQRLQGPEVMDVIAQNSKELTGQSQKMESLVRKISRSPVRSQSDIYKISFKQ